jgi:hypothetical protein
VGRGMRAGLPHGGLPSWRSALTEITFQTCIENIMVKHNLNKYVGAKNMYPPL